MRGAGAEVRGVGEKWMRINQLLREKKIAVLALQETHLTTEGATAIMALFGEYMKVFPSAYPGNETGRCGVAFVINRRILKDSECRVEELVPGRAIALDLKWPVEGWMRFVNVYGPNDMRENANLWIELAGLDGLTAKPTDVLLGDFNVVEDPIDRLPARPDRESACAALGSLLRALDLRDEWRESNPNTKVFTYLHVNNGSQSRLDRIYTRMVCHRDAVDWCVMEPGLSTDHNVVAVTFYDRTAPFVGRGRWVMPKHLLTDEKLVGVMKALAGDMLREMEQIYDRTPAHNPQSVYKAFKEKLVAAVRARAKEKVPKMQRQIDALRADLHATLNLLN